jgi:hypothetical protein
VRRQFERRFTADRMAADYLAVYQRLLSQVQSDASVANDWRDFSLPAAEIAAPALQGELPDPSNLVRA